MSDERNTKKQVSREGVPSATRDERNTKKQVSQEAFPKATSKERITKKQVSQEAFPDAAREERVTQKLASPAAIPDAPNAPEPPAVAAPSEPTPAEQPPSFDPYEHQSVTVPPGFRLEMLQKQLPTLDEKYLKDTLPPKQPTPPTPEVVEHSFDPPTVLSAHKYRERDNKRWFILAVGAIIVAGFLALAVLSSERGDPASEGTPASATATSTAPSTAPTEDQPITPPPLAPAKVTESARALPRPVPQPKSSAPATTTGPLAVPSAPAPERAKTDDDFVPLAPPD